MNKLACSLVEIEWLDHNGHREDIWQRLDDYVEPVSVRSVGYVLRDEDTHYEIISRLSADNATGAHLSILKSCITGIRVLS